IVFKILQPTRGSKVQAVFKKNADDEGDRITGTSVTKDVDAPGDYFILISAPEPGVQAKYALQTIWQPANVISAEVLEIQKAGGAGGFVEADGHGRGAAGAERRDGGVGARSSVPARRTSISGMTTCVSGSWRTGSMCSGPLVSVDYFTLRERSLALPQAAV